MTEPAPNADCSEQYLVSHGKSGAVGSCVAQDALCLRRGDRVIIDTFRGREVGTVLCPANVHQARLLATVSSGKIVRVLTPGDELLLERLRADAELLFEAGRRLARARSLPLEILDSEVLLDGGALLHFVGTGDAVLDSFIEELRKSFPFDIRLENLALAEEDHAEHEAGCGKPDCGRTEGSGCSTCETGGGCSSCGSGKVDLRAYFGNLRNQMEASQRQPLSVT